MWANILFALLTLLPVASLASSCCLSQAGINLWLPSFIRISFCLSRCLRFSFLFSLSLSAVRVAVTRIWIIRQMCQVEMLKFPTTFHLLPPLAPRYSLCPAGRKLASGARCFRFGGTEVTTAKWLQMNGSEWLRMLPSGYMEMPPLPRPARLLQRMRRLA